VFDAPYVSARYIDAVRRTVPTDSPLSPDVSTDVFTRPISFTDPNKPRMITGGERAYAAQGYGYVSHRGHASPFGQHVQGMGPTPGFIVENVGPPPLPIHGRRMVQTPHGMTEGGIFGQRAVIGGMAVGARVPGVATKEIMVERTVRPLTGYRGFGAGPDGLGRR
jgi:hypothetical protein